MARSKQVFSRSILSAVIASCVAGMAHATPANINTSVTGTQSFTSSTTSITVTASGHIDATQGPLSPIGDLDDGIALNGGGHNISAITVAEGGVIDAQWDGIYTGDEGANTIGTIIINGAVNSTQYGGGIGVSVDLETTVTGDVTVGASGNITANGTLCDVADCGASQSGIAVIGVVNGDVINGGTITASNGLTVLGAKQSVSGTMFGGTLKGDLINDTGGTINTTDGGLKVFSGGTVEGSVINRGDINGSGGNASGIKITGATINYNEVSDAVNGIIPGDTQTVVQGSVINSGTITSQFDGIALQDNVLIGGNVQNSGTIDVSSVTDGDAAAIYIGDDDDVSGALPTITGSIINSGTLISDTSLESAPVADRIATVELNGSFAQFSNSNLIRNLDSQGTAIRSYNSGDILNNSGTIEGTVRMAGGTFNSTGGTTDEIIGAGTINIKQSGNSSQTVSTLNGNLTFNGTLGIDAVGIEVAEEGKNAADLTDTITGSRLSVSGAANLTGASVNMNVTGDRFIDEGDEFVFLDATSVTSDITRASDNSALLAFDIEQRGNTLVAIAAQGDATEVLDQLPGGNTGNNQQVGEAINELNEALGDGEIDENSELGQLLGDLQAVDEDEFVAAVESLQPEASNSGSTSGAVSADNAAASTVENRQSSLRAPAFSGLAAGDDTVAINGFWAQLYDSDTDQDNVDDVDGFDADTYGVAIGFDMPLDENTNVGVALSYANTDMDSKGAEGNSMDIDSYRLTGYGSYNAESYYLDAQISYARNQYDGKRNLFNGLVATNDHDGDQYSLRVRGGYPMAFDNGIYFTPKASLEYTYLSEDSYNEKGAGNAGLRIETDDVEALVAGIGGEVSYAITTDNYTFIPDFHMMVQHDFIGDEVEVDSNFLGAASAAFITEGANAEQTGINSGIGLRIFGESNLSVALRYDYLYKKDYSAQSYSATLRYDF